jgi:hypothetical protein
VQKDHPAEEPYGCLFAVSDKNLLAQVLERIDVLK